MKKINCFVLLLFSGFLLFSCDTETKKEEGDQTNEETPEDKVQENVKFRYELQEVAYPDAMLELYSPLENEAFEKGSVPFEFNIKNYPFEHGVKGFQLQMIINGNDPIGYNMPIFRKELETGSYKVLAYLVDEKGLALKEYGNYVERDFTVGDSKPFPESEDPYIGVNLPQNGQEFDLDEEVIVDFILVGGDLKEDQLQIRVRVDEQEYTFQELGQVKISNLPKGEHKVSVALVDEEGNEVPGVFSKSIKQIMVNG
ncbi:hypothetical protein [Echinicola sp. 20G]|uniref:hypothetical protein n=1 Tax=Echinicola sp. 20G TaxID=2781961 RepID=UPI00190FCCC3|nr:hypothetical protein [Echinicola sp. 20G]